jgi:hypothetical protein
VQTEYVRLIRGGGDKSHWTLQQIDNWTDKGAGYQVALNYRIETPEATFNLVVTASGVWPSGAARRQWYINAGSDSTGRARNSAVNFTPRGKQLISQWSEDPGNGARAFVQRWAHNLTRQNDGTQPYLATLPPDVRRRFDQNPFAAAFDPAVRTQLTAEMTGRNAYLAGDLVRADDATFWPPPREEKDGVKVEGRGMKYVNEVKSAFTPGSDVIRNLTVHPSLPQWQEGETITFRYNVQLMAGRDVIEGQVVVEAKRADLENSVEEPWRLTELDLQRARTTEDAKGPRRRGP